MHGRVLPLLLAALVAVGALVVDGCSDGTVDDADVSGEAAHLVVYMRPNASEAELDGVKVQLELDEAEGTVERFEYWDEDLARRVAEAAARAEGGQVPADVQTLYLVWLTDPEADATTMATSYGSMPGVTGTDPAPEPAPTTTSAGAGEAPEPTEGG